MLRVISLAGDKKNNRFLLFFTTGNGMGAGFNAPGGALDGHGAHEILEYAINFLEASEWQIVSVIKTNHQTESQYSGIEHFPVYYQIIAKHVA